MPASSRSLLLLATLLIFSPEAKAGNYTPSAHGHVTAGVERGTILGYDQGNCAHCHEQHASIRSTDPTPSGGPKSYNLFARNFNDSNAANPVTYVEGDNICFYCHDGSNTVQSTAFNNYDHSRTFGCAPTAGVTSILAAFNQTVFHDLKDIWTFSLRNDKNPSFTFGKQKNPCGACHNPHRARRNIENTSNTALSALSLPTDPSALYGVTEKMNMYDPTSEYASPKCDAKTEREPNRTTATDGSKTPYYPGLCTECHNADNYDSSPTGTGIWSTRLNRYLKPIDWSAEKHGRLQFDGARDIQFPYNDTQYASSELILSCLDCHEPHGSDNIYLLRRRVNGRDLGGTIDTCDSMQYGFLCEACHSGANDSISGYSTNGPSWDSYDWDSGFGEYKAHGTHHDTTDAPGQTWGCIDCHSSTDPPFGDTLNCNLCHFHGASRTNDSETRVTF